MLFRSSVDRCLAVCQPLRSLRRRTDRVYVLCSWLPSLIFSIPQVGIFSLREVGAGVYDRSEERRVGKEGLRLCSLPWSPSHAKTTPSSHLLKVEAGTLVNIQQLPFLL